MVYFCFLLLLLSCFFVCFVLFFCVHSFETNMAPVAWWTSASGLRADAFPCLSWRGVRAVRTPASGYVSVLYRDPGAAGAGSMAPKGGNKQQSEEDLLLQDFSRNLSAKSTALFYGNALIVSAIPICKCRAVHANRLITLCPQCSCASSFTKHTLILYNILLS